MTRRRRRVVAPPTRLGATEEGDLTALAPGRVTPTRAPGPGGPGAAATAGPGGPAPAPAADRPAIPDRAREDSDEAWGERPEDDGRMLREKPPHWQ